MPTIRFYSVVGGILAFSQRFSVEQLRGLKTLHRVSIVHPIRLALSGIVHQYIKRVEIDPRAIIDAFLNWLISRVFDVFVRINSSKQLAVDGNLTRELDTDEHKPRDRTRDLRQLTRWTSG